MQGAGPPPALLAVVECIAANCIIGLQMPPATGTTGPGSSSKYLCIIFLCKLLFNGQDVGLVFVNMKESSCLLNIDSLSEVFNTSICLALQFETRS